MVPGDRDVVEKDVAGRIAACADFVGIEQEPGPRIGTVGAVWGSVFESVGVAFEGDDFGRVSDHPRGSVDGRHLRVSG